MDMEQLTAKLPQHVKLVVEPVMSTRAKDFLRLKPLVPNVMDWAKRLIKNAAHVTVPELLINNAHWM